MSNAFDILQGHINEVLNREEDLSQSRLDICKQCPILKESAAFGSICDSTKYISPDGQDWDIKYHEGWTRGCGCRLKAKTRLKNAHCIINKW